MSKVKHIGDWRRDVKIHNVHHKIATIKWTHKPSEKMFSFESPVPVGMENLLKKLESAQNRSFEAIPMAVRDEFSITDKNYKSSDYDVNVSFSSTKYYDFRLLYCHICTSKKNLKENFWNKYPEKLPEGKIDKQELMTSWDSLNLTWNSCSGMHFT